MAISAIPRLLAKSCANPLQIRGEETLHGHTALVLMAAKQLLAARSQYALASAGLPFSLSSRLSKIVLCGAFAHDLGKCSDHFQLMVRRQRNVPQLLRHEALSLVLCWPGKSVASWLRQAVDSDEDYLLALLAAAGHHRKFQSNAIASTDSGAGSSITLLVSHTDFGRTLSLGTSELSLPAPPSFQADLTLLIARRQWQPAAEFLEMRRVAEAVIRPGTMEARLLPIVKALILDADVAGSVLPRSGEKSDWVERSLRPKCRQDEIAKIVEKRLNGSEPRPFQIEVSESQHPITLVLAGCGTGKTLAAYLWATKQHAGRQIWMTYPTTGTATEGFREYLHGVDSVESELMHSRAEVDLEIFHLHDEGGTSRGRDRLDAIRHWDRDVITCTVDTVLGLVQNQRRGIYAFAGLCHSAVIFDEIHAYDDLLFGCLLRFLEGMPGVPVLLMTASLPNERLNALQSLCSRVHNLSLAILHGPADLETLPRYRIVADADPWSLVTECLKQNGKVLWVNNTVERAIATAEKGQEHAPIIYHSRFRYQDRIERHAAVINAFKGHVPAFAVTTQVCEMSLDLSADLLISDLAPIPSLIQRLGRLNRRSTPFAPAPIRPCLVLPFQGLPYGEDELAIAGQWLARLANRDLHQKDLSQAWAALVQQSPAIQRIPCSWLDGIFDTEVNSAREGSPGVSVLLPDDAPKVRDNAALATRYSLPMNPPPRAQLRALGGWPQVQGHLIPPRDAISYDPQKGAQWAK